MTDDFVLHAGAGAKVQIAVHCIADRAVGSVLPGILGRPFPFTEGEDEPAVLIDIHLVRQLFLLACAASEVASEAASAFSVTGAVCFSAVSVSAAKQVAGSTPVIRKPAIRPAVIRLIFIFGFLLVIVRYGVLLRINTDSPLGGQ